MLIARARFAWSRPLKAIIRERYGSADVLQLKDVEKPVPSDDRALVKIHASSVNLADLHDMTGGLVRFMGGGVSKPKDPRFGRDFAGVVEEVGSKVTKLKPGDAVFGVCPGALAEYGCVLEKRVALKPANISFEEAAAVPVAGITALQGLRNKGGIRSGQKVLVNGASGGVGTFAVQVAKSYGTEVTAVCSTGKMDQARSIGADHVIDYTKEDFGKNGQRYDLICDVASTRSPFAYKGSLSPGGVCVIIGMPNLARFPLTLILSPLASRGGKKVGFMGIADVTSDDMGVLAALLEAKKVKPVVEKRYSMSETAEAVRYLQEGHAKGKIVVTVG
jgi:NADPH:quinone reductase-like Zn-dependent oxidoreductase